MLLKQLCSDVSGADLISQEIAACLSAKGPSSLIEIKKQVNALIDLYKETGEKLMEEESQLKQKIENKSVEINEQRRNKIRQAWREKRKNVKYEKNKRLLIILTAIITLYLAFKLLPAVIVEYAAGYSKSILK